MDDVLLKITGVDKFFPGVKALTNACLNVYPGRVMALMGENGAGKSTLMKVLTGIYHCDRGDIEYLGNLVKFNGAKSSQEAGISIIHQELNIINNLTVAENIFLGREFQTKWGAVDWLKMYVEADKLLARLNVSYRSNIIASELSIGELQMVEIAKALSFESRILIMDEPTDALTDIETNSLFKIINELKSEGRGIVYISHRIKEIFEICDDVTVLRDGEFIGEKLISKLDEEHLIEMMVGRKLEKQYPHINKKAGQIILNVNNIVGDDIDHVSFSMKKCEIVGVAGLMGAGRSELAKMIYGVLPIYSGEIIMEGKSIINNSAKDALTNGIVYISEDRKREGLILEMSVKDNMSLIALETFTHYGKINFLEEEMAVSDFVTLFNIKTPSIFQETSLLSGGNQQKVSIAKGLMIKPKVLILDEPTRGVDVGAKKEIYQLINKLKNEGLSILLISSEMPEILGMSDRILVMHEGKISGEYTRREATQEKLLAAALGKVLV